MTEEWVIGLQKIIEQREQRRNAIKAALVEFQEKLYSTIERKLNHVRESGFEDLFSEARRQVGTMDSQELVFTVDDLELVFVPLQGTGHDETASKTYFANVLTAKILVFPNKLDARPIYSYWINSDGNWSGKGFSPDFMGRTDNLLDIETHVNLLFVSVLSLPPQWTSDSALTYDGLTKGTKTKLGVVWA